MINTFLSSIKKLIIIVAIALLMALIFLVYVLIFSSNKTNLSFPTSTSRQVDKVVVIIDGHQFKSYLADTPISQKRGLSIIDSLPQGEGMLFVFPNSDYRRFWMKGMKFPIDILWIRNDKLIGFQKNASVLIVKNISNLPVYVSPEPVNKVLEINAGLVAKYGFKKGDNISVKLTK